MSQAEDGTPPRPSALGSSTGARPGHYQAAGKRAHHSVHINVKADPAESLAASITPPRVPAWLSPRAGTDGASGRSASTRMSYGVPATPDGPGPSTGLPAPVPSTPLKEHVRIYSTDSAGGRFRQAVSNALRRLEVRAWRKGLIPADSARTFDRRAGAGDGLLARAWHLLLAVIGALWIDPKALSTPRTRQTPLILDERDDRSSKSSLERVLNAYLDPTRQKFGLSRAAFLIVCALLLVGLWEGTARSRQSPLTSNKYLKAGSDAFKPLDRLGVLTERSRGRFVEADDPLTLRGMWLYPHWERSPGQLLQRGTVDADVTAVVLNWKRLENVKIVVAYLCRYDFFRTVVVWNNNADAPVSRQDFHSTHCPAHRLQIVNAPRNLFFYARFLACANAPTAHCYFQDDDWIVQPLRSMYAQYRRDPQGSGLVVQTDTKTSLLYGWEWCFYNHPMNACFAWLGTGAFISRAQVLSFLDLVSSLPLPVDETALADNFFSTALNAPPYVFAQSALMQLPSPQGFSDGSGLARNKHYIQRGIDRLGRLLETRHFPTLPTQLDLPAWTANLSFPSPYPLPPHPYSHHVRAANPSDTVSFITNVANLPPPDSVIYPSGGAKGADLTTWEDRLGWIARGWVEGGELYADGERWALDWAYSRAVDGDARTAWRSPDGPSILEIGTDELLTSSAVVQKDDYIGLALIAPAKAINTPSVDFHVMLEHSSEIISSLAVEVSTDGIFWRPPVPAPMSFACLQTKHASRIPDLSFPDSPLLSSTARSIRTADQKVAEGLQGWMRRRRRRSARLRDCSVTLDTRWPAAEAGSASGWQFVRVRATGGGSRVGWGVYGIKLGGRIT